MKWMGWAALLPWLIAAPLAAQEAGEPVAEAAPASPTRLAELEVEANAERPALIPTQRLASQPVLRYAQLSPDGAHFAFLLDTPIMTAISVATPDSDAMTRNFALPDGFDVIDFRWAGDGRIIAEGIGIHATPRVLYRVRRLYVMSLEDGVVRPLIAASFVSSYADIIGVAKDGSYAMIAHAEDPDDYEENEPAVFRYDLSGANAPALEQPAVRGISDWTVDDAGTVRLGIGLEGNTINVWHRAAPGEPLRKISATDRDDEDGASTALSMTTGSSSAYILRRVDGAPVGLHLFDYASGTITETLYENAQWDVEDVWFREGKPVAVSYTDDAQRIVWFDEADQLLYDELYSALGGGKLQLVVTSRSRDNSRLLVWAGDEADPGVIYLFDRAKRDLKVLAAVRPDLDFSLLTRPQPIAYTARDGTNIRGYLTLPRGREPRGLPLIIMPHGGPYGVRDTLSYNDEVQLLANRGYAVLQPNFRGSGGYGEAFLELGTGEVGRGMQDDLDDAMDWAVGQGIADPARVCVVGGSYGGYAALWAVLRNPERYACAASWAGVTDWDRILQYDKKFLSREGRRRWRSRIEGGENFDLDSVSPYRLAGRLNRPVLLAHGTRDSVVPFTQYEDMLKAARNAPVPPTPLVVHNSGHSFTKSRDAQIWFDALDSFLAKHNPADQLDANGQWVAPRVPFGGVNSVPLNVVAPDADENAEETSAQVDNGTASLAGGETMVAD